MEENKYKKLITMSLAGLLVGSLLFIFGMSVKENIIPLLANYLMAMALYMSSFLAVFNNHREYPASIFKYILVLSGFLMILITSATLMEFI